MASYDAAINLIINGGSKIDQIINKAAQLEGIVNSLNKTPLDLSVKKATSEFDKFDTNLKALKTEIGNQQKALDAASNSIDKYTDKILSTQRQLSTLSPNTKKYNEVLERQQKAIEGLAGAQKALASAEQNLATQEGKLTGTQKAAGRAKATKLATEALSNLADEYLRLGAAQEKGATGQILKNQSQSTIARLAAQADALKLVADNSEIASSQFNRFAIASQLASQKIYEGRQKQLGALAFGLSKEAPSVNIGTGGKSSIAAARDTIDSLIGSYGSVVKSEAALSSYISRLQSLQSLVPYLSEEYNKLERAIGDVSAEMESLQKMTQLRGAASKIQPQAGPASLLPSESVKSAAEQSKYYTKLEEKKEILLDKQSKILGKVNDSLLAEGRKKALNLEIDKATELVISNQVEEAEKLTKEIDKQLKLQEKLLKSKKEQVFGVLGQDFLPVSGRLKSGELVPGSPAFKQQINENERKRSDRQIKEERQAFADLIKYTEQATSAAEKLGNAQKRAFIVEEIDSYLNDIANVEDAADRFLKKDKQLLRQFDQDLGISDFVKKSRREVSDLTAAWIKRGGPALPPAPRPEPNIPGAVKLGGFAETKERSVYTKKIADLTLAIDEAEKRIFRTTAGELAQKELLNEVQAARNALLDNDLEKSKRIVQQIDRNRFSLERQQKDQKASAKGLQDEAERRKRIGDQFRILETIQKTYIDLEGKGVKFSREKLQLSNLLAKADRAPAEASARYVRALDQQISKFRTFQQLRKSEAVAAGTFASPVRPQTAERVETVRKNLLNQALGIERQIIGVESKGGSIADEKVKIEQTILQLKNLQNQSTQQQNELIAQQLIDSRAITKEEANRLAKLGIGKDKDKAKEPGTGLQAALDKLAEARAARVSFLGEGVSPAEAIDKIVRQFGTKKDIGAGVGANVTNALASEIAAGVPKAAAAGTALGDAVEGGLEKGLEIKSPSGVALRIARNVVNTLANALNQGKSIIQAASEALFSSLKGEGDQVKTELEQTFGGFKRQFASLTTKPRYFNRLLSKIPDTGLTVEMAGAATDVFNKIKLPDILEGQIKEAYIKEFGKLPSFFADLVDEIKNLLNKVLPSGAGGGGRPPVPPGGGGVKDAGDFYDRLQQAKAEGPQALLGLEELRQPARASINELNALSAVLTELRGVLDPTAAGFDRLDNQIRETLATVSRQLEVRAPEADFLTRRTGDPRLARGLSEGLIGGAFPLLFGQGIGASVGGGLGGFAGGFAGGGLGFGLSLLGTALGTALDQLGATAAETGKALRDPIAGFEKLKEANLFASKTQEFYIQKLIESGKAAQAAAIVQSEIVKKIGVTGVSDLNRLGKASNDLSKTWAEFNLQLQAAVAGPLAKLLEWVTSIVSVGNQFRRDASFVEDISSGLAGKDKEEFDKRRKEITDKLYRSIAFGGITRDEALRREKQLAQEFAGRSQPQVRGTQASPETQEQQIKAAQQAADEIKQAYREGFKFQQQAIDLERQAADFRRQVASEIFEKQQAVQRLQIEAEQLAADVRIKAVDLEYQKRINQEEGLVAQLLQAEADLIRVKATGQADIDAKRKLLDLDIAKQQRSTQDYIRNVSAQVDNIRRQTLQYEMETQDSREASERRIAELRRIDQMGAASGPVQTAPNGRPYYGPGGAPAGAMGTVQSRGGYTGSFVDGFPITSRPGARWGRTHRGVDIGTPMGTALGYEVGGEVLRATTLDGYGKVLEVKLENGVIAFAAHLNEVLVKAGDRFTANQILAKTGNTGESTGPHVHMEGARGGDPYSPLPYLQLGSMRANSQIRQMQQAQSQIRPVNIQMVNTEALGQVSTQLDAQDAAARRNIVNLQGQSNALEAEAARERLLNLARGEKGLEQRKYQINLLTKQAQYTSALSNEERDLGMLAGEYQADVERMVADKVRFLELSKSDAAEQQKITNAFEEGFAARKKQYDLDLKILGITRMEAAARSGREAVAAFAEQNKQLDLEIQKRRLRLKLITEGNNPEQIEAKMRVFELQNKLTESLDKLNKETNSAIKAEAARLGINSDMITSTFRLTEATLESLVATEQDTKKKEEYRKELERILALRKQLEGGVAADSADAINKAKTVAPSPVIPGEKIGEAYGAAKEKLDSLVNSENQAIFAAQTISDAFGGAFREIIAGTATAQEVLSGFFQNLANSFADMASQIIAEMIKMFILKQLLNLFGGGGGSAIAKTFEMPGDAFIPKGGYKFADGGMFGSGIKPFAMGGVVNSPTLFQFANGGAMSTGVMGEAGPEAIMPLKRGSDGKLGVSASGGGDVSVTVNVDAKGTSVQGNDQTGNQLGRAISAAVQQEIIKQRRPGGLLS